jgi:hypothetical protein
VRNWQWKWELISINTERLQVLWIPNGLLCYEFQLEEAFQKQQQDEMAARQAEKERVERERIEARKRREVQRITEV